MSKILLVQPWAYSKFPGMPMGLVSVGSALEEAGHEVNAIDLAATPKTDRDLEEIVSNGFNIVMVGGTSPSHPEALDIAKLVKRTNPEIAVVKGGPHEDAHIKYAEQTATHPEIDVVVRGDGEAIASLVETNKWNDLIKEGRIDYRKKILDLKLPMSDSTTLADVPMPNRQLLYSQNPGYYNFLVDENGKPLPTFQTRSFRGCTFRCTYCSQAVAYRQHSLAWIDNDLGRMKDRGFKAFYWDDALFTMNPNGMLEKKLGLLENNYNGDFTMGCITRAGVNTSEENFRRMYNVGFKLVWLSLESGDESILQEMHRDKTGPDVVTEAVKNAKKAGLQTYVNIIVGSPRESDVTIQHTIDAIKRIMPDGVSTSVYTVYPGSPISLKGELPCPMDRYDKPMNRDARLMQFDEGYGGNIIVDPSQAVEWYSRIGKAIAQDGIVMLGFRECKTAKHLLETAKKAR